MRKNVVMMTVLTISLVFALMLVAMPAVGAGDGACDWTGTWDTCWGKIEFVQTEPRVVTGTASLILPQRLNLTVKPDNANIEALVTGNMLEGFWAIYPSYCPPEDAGDLLFIISEDCSSFEGKWRYGHLSGARTDSNWDGVWTGSRVGPSKQASKRTVCASAKISITDGSEFTTAEFTIGGAEPQEFRITQPAENFGIVNVYGGRYGGRVYQRIDGKSWGSLTLEPGTYRLSCGGGGAMNLMSATVCIEYPRIEETPTGPEEELPEVEHPPELPDLSGKETKPTLPLGPIERIIVYPKNENLGMGDLVMEIGKKKQFDAWGEDANRNKMSVTVDEWKVRRIDENIGSIDKETGEFTAGPNEGDVKIMAKVGDITGVFRITVTKEPPITFIGCVKLYDENKKLFYPPGGAEVNLCGEAYADLKDLKEGLHSIAWMEDLDAQTDEKGRFKFVVPAYVDEPFVGWTLTLKDPPTTLPGYYWSHRTIPSSQVVPIFSNEANTLDIIEPGRRITIAPKGIKCFELWLEKRPTSLFINGEVTHHRKAVGDVDVTVRLFDNGKCVKETLINYDGEFTLDVSNLPKGRYMLTAKYKPKKKQITTVHKWLYIKEDIPVDLPLPTETKTIDIEMISYAEKIGYTGP